MQGRLDKPSSPPPSTYGHNPGRRIAPLSRERGCCANPERTSSRRRRWRGATAGGVEEAARRQTLFREVNENIAKLTGLLNETGYNLFICECSVPDCADSLEITADEYESVRAQGTRFVVVPGHQLDALERVVDGNSRFIVVEKVGRAAEIANGHDPRRS